MTLTIESCCRHTDADTQIAIKPRYGSGTISVHVRYRLIGTPGTPLYVLAGGTSAGRRSAASPGDATRGWWDAGVRALNLDRCQILSIDWLTTQDTATGSISTADQAQAIAGVLDELGLVADRFIGCSYGGMVGQAFAIDYPTKLEALTIISAAHRSHPMTTAVRVIQRRIVALRGDSEGLALARALAVTTYRSSEEFSERFVDPPSLEPTRFEVENYLDAVGTRFVNAISPSRFLALSESTDLHEVQPAEITVPMTLIAVREDRIVPVSDMRALADSAAGPVRFHEINGYYGHDTFLKEPARLCALFA